MAPEVAKSEPYNLTADVYSFGLLLWQVCSLDLPYEGMNRQDHSELVVYGNERPQLDSSWSTPLRILMKRAWEPDPAVRPSMDSIYKILRREICSLRDGDETGLEHWSRRSTFVLNRDSHANPDPAHRVRRNPLRNDPLQRGNAHPTNPINPNLVTCGSGKQLLFGVERTPSDAALSALASQG
jgi:hypothetical protein